MRHLIGSPRYRCIGGSCNTAPIGVLPSTDNMPSAKFIFPPNFDAVTKSETFTVKLAINHLETGWFTNPQTNFMSAPQEINANGDIMGHSHIVIEQLTGFGQTTPTDPRTFVFFKALNDPAVDGVLSTDVTGGLSPGYYRIAAFHTGANHQPSMSDRSRTTQCLTDCRSRIRSCCPCCPARSFG